MNSTRAWSQIAGVIIAALSFALAGAGTAGATVDDFIYDLDTVGIIGPRQDLVNLGQIACSGASQEYSVRQIADASMLGLDRATYIYESARTFLC
jgi:hypothetical protein